MTVEERLRATTEAVTTAMRPVRPLSLHLWEDLADDLAKAPARPRRPLLPDRWRAGLIPLAAALAVVAVAATLVAVKSQSHPAGGAGTAPAGGSTAEAPPRYFVAIDNLQTEAPTYRGKNGPLDPVPADSIVVGDTLTGRRIAAVAPPAGSTFSGVTGAGDDRTFVLDTVPIQRGILSGASRHTWYLLKVAPDATQVTTLTRLSLPVPDDVYVSGISLSPDGTRLAVFYRVPGASVITATDSPYYPYGPFTLAVYSVPGGTLVHSWTSKVSIESMLVSEPISPPDSNNQLSWTADGQHLAFAYDGQPTPQGTILSGESYLDLNEVNLAGRGSDLLADSTLIARVPNSGLATTGGLQCDSLGITGDGRAVLCGGRLPSHPRAGAPADVLPTQAPETGATPGTGAVTVPTNAGFAEITPGGDTLARVLYQVTLPATAPSGASFSWGNAGASALWSSPSGNTVIGVTSYTHAGTQAETGPTPLRNALIVVSGGKATTLKSPEALTVLYAGTVAF